ncbi:MAG: acyl-CoA dehydrogenase family protein, partial [Fimbriimonadaceae bacterium]
MSATMTTPSAPVLIPTLNAEESQFLDRVRAFVAEHVAPYTREWENDTFAADIWTKLGAAGMLDVTVPKAMGGSER